jgi:hypothetical protein
MTTPQSDTDHAAAIAEFMRKKGVTRCPTVCVVATHGSTSEADRSALRNYNEAREAARLARIQNYRQMLRPSAA